MNKIIVIGAGKTGRGFIARLLQEAKKEIVLVDKDAELVKSLNEQKEFEVRFFGGVREAYKVNNFVAYTWEAEELKDIFADVELIFVSVGGQNLKVVGEQLAKVLAEEKHYYIITAENASRPSETLKNAIGKENISVSESTVFCTTIEDEGIHINSENYPYLQCNAELLDGYVPDALIEAAHIDGADWFHFTGITPALGPNVVEICRQACKAAKAHGVKISCDLNYRGKLWTRAEAREAMNKFKMEAANDLDVPDPY